MMYTCIYVKQKIKNTSNKSGERERERDIRIEKMDDADMSLVVGELYK